MKLFRIRAVARKELLHIVRDPRSLGMAVAIPMLLLVLFGFALTLDVDRVPLAVWDQSATPESRALVNRFDGSRYFEIRVAVRDDRELERAIDDRRALAALVVPVDFADRLASGRDAPVQLVVDGSDANTATLAMAYARAVAAAHSREIAVAAAPRGAGATVAAPIELRSRVWFNTQLESRNYIIPGLIAVIMMVIAALLTSLTISREWERGTMEQLISTPVRGPELILGKLVPYFAIGLLDVALAVLMGTVVFHVPLRGSLVLLFGMAALFLTGALSIGMLVSIVARNQLLATQMAVVMTFLPSFLLSGFMFAIANMPRPIRVFTYLIPARYFVALLKGIYLKGTGLRILGAEAALLALFSAGVLAAALVRFRKKMTA